MVDPHLTADIGMPFIRRLRAASAGVSRRLPIGSSVLQASCLEEVRNVDYTPKPLA
jgi:hypothetical protein